MVAISNDNKRYLVESWKSKLNVVDNVRGGMSDDSKLTLAKVLQNSKDALRVQKQIRNEGLSTYTNSATQMGGIDWFPQNMINMVSAIYASQISEDLVSVQAIDNPIGVIRFLQYVYGDNRGSAVRGGVAIDEWGAMRGVADGNIVASPRVSGEGAGSASSNVLDVYAQHLPLVVDAENSIDLHADDGSAHLRLKRTASGTFEMKEVDAKGYEQAHAGFTSAAVDSESGHIVIQDTTLGTKGWLIDYTQDLSTVPTDSMNLELRLRTEMVKAIPHKIRANFAFDAGYAYSKSHGINVEEALINACTAEIRQERDNEVINLLTRQAGNSSQWDRSVTSYISQREHDEAFLSELFACASQINFATKRAFGNWAVVGRQGLNILNSVGAGRFAPAGANTQNNGAFVAGELDGRMKIIYSPYVAENSYLVGYKGSDIDAGFVLADYLPLAKTDMVMLDDFIGRQGMVSYYGTKMVNPDMYVRGTIVNGW